MYKWFKFNMVPWNVGSEVDPFPSTLVAKTVTPMSAAGGQRDVEVSKLKEWAHISSVHNEAGMVAEPQILPEVESEYVIVYEIVEPSISSDIWNGCYKN